VSVNYYGGSNGSVCKGWNWLSCLGLQLQSFAVALICTGCLLLWQAVTVHYSYNGNWTALYCTGSSHPAPAALRQSENIYYFPNSSGYDGQFYHYIAHDPFFRRGFAACIDATAMRYRRILVPGLAFLLACGRDGAIDGAYIFVTAAFIFLGAYWLSRLALSEGHSAWWGLLFAAVPAVLISVDRLTVDAALAACCVGFAWYTRYAAPYRLYAVLAAAALARETGLLLIAAYAIYLLGKRTVRQAAAFATAALPAACWYVFVELHTRSSISGIFSAALLTGFVHRVMNPYPYPFGAFITALARTLDLLALAGILGGLVWALQRALRRSWTPVTVGIYLFAILTITLSSADVWLEVYAFGRALTPLLLLSAVDGLSVGSAKPLWAMLALDPRIGMQMGEQILKIARGIGL
jgi:hypothetical protein